MTGTEIRRHAVSQRRDKQGVGYGTKQHGDDRDRVSYRRYLTTIEAAEHLNVSKSYLDKARVRGDGPAFIRIGGAVRYAVEDLDAFAASRRVRSTSEAA